jgi:hypothetical protein
MPSHEEDIHLILTIQNTVTTQPNGHLGHTYNLCGNFNRYIFFFIKQNDQQTTPP